MYTRVTAGIVERSRPWRERESPRSSDHSFKRTTMGKKGKKAQAGKPKRLTPKDVGKRLDVLVKKLKEELKGADLFAPLPPTEDCAICLVPLSRVATNSTYFACCGNMICVGCAQENEA